MRTFRIVMAVLRRPLHPLIARPGQNGLARESGAAIELNYTLGQECAQSDNGEFQAVNASWIHRPAARVMGRLRF